MADVTYKQADTWPPLQRQLKQNVDGVVSLVDLSTATVVKFIAKSQDGLTTITNTGTFVDKPNGIVQFTFAGTDLAVVGTYNCEIEITWGAGQYETFPNDSYFTMLIVADLGGTVG